MFLRDMLLPAKDVVVRKKQGKNKRGNNNQKKKEYKVLDNRDILPFAVQLQTPDPYTHPEIKQKRVLASAFEIMRDGPLGGAAFNNEFGRPALTGYFRCFEDHTVATDVRGYDKPIMLAGGVGNIRAEHVEKCAIEPGTKIVVLGGPAMLIGLGGGAASSMRAGASDSDLDFASVQRDNPEMQRRCQEVINACWALGERNPALSIHDVGAGGLSNAVPEILHDSDRGGVIELRAIPNADPAMSPLEIWCNEAQERYVLAIAADRIDEFMAICRARALPGRGDRRGNGRHAPDDPGPRRGQRSDRPADGRDIRQTAEDVS